jgi:hypothetical protein
MTELGGFALSLKTPISLVAFYFCHKIYIANMIMYLYNQRVKTEQVECSLDFDKKTAE